MEVDADGAGKEKPSDDKENKENKENKETVGADEKTPDESGESKPSEAEEEVCQEYVIFE